MVYTKVCIVCNKEFTKAYTCSQKEWTKRIACSVPCENKRRKGQHVSPQTEFKKGHTLLKGRKFPNRKNSGQFKKGLKPWNKGIKTGHIPWNKGKEWTKIQGKNHWNWKGGKGDTKAIIRASYKYKEWRKAIFKRDDWTCVFCGVRRKKGNRVVLNADHIKPFSKILETNQIETLQQAKKCKILWDIDNGRTLCIACHRETDTWGLNQYTK